MKRLWILCLLLGCQRGERHASAAWSELTRATTLSPSTPRTAVLPDAALKPYLPERLLGRAGEAPHGSVTRIGPRALSEVTRAYGAGEAELKLADARFEPHATEAIRGLAGEPAAPAEPADDDSTGGAERLVLPGAIGYARYDEEERIAQAQVVIAGRIIASATVKQAADAQAAVAALQAVDTLGLSKLAAE